MVCNSMLRKESFSVRVNCLSNPSLLIEPNRLLAEKTSYHTDVFVRPFKLTHSESDLMDIVAMLPTVNESNVTTAKLMQLANLMLEVKLNF